MLTAAFALAVLLHGAEAQAVPTAVLHGAHLLVADGEGDLRAWSSKDLRFDPERSRQLSMAGLLAVARSGEQLWSFDGTRTFTWDDGGGRWVPGPSVPSMKGCTHFAVPAGSPVALCGRGVHRYADGRFFEPPLLLSTNQGRPFEGGRHVVASHGTRLAIGTGLGEWGGMFHVLDLATRQWTRSADSLGGPVGVTWTGSEWAVAWSMSHFHPSTRVRLHRPDSTVAREGPELPDSYLRAIAFEPVTKRLVALEQNDLVHVSESLELERLQHLDPLPYGTERHAVGVSSGIAVFLPLDGERTLIVPFEGPPVAVVRGAMIPLPVPPHEGPVKAKRPGR